MTLTGPAGEFLTGGQTIVCTPADGNFQMVRDFSAQNGISLFFHNADYSSYWQVDFCGPNQAPLQLGQYHNAHRSPFVGGPYGGAGIQVVGDHRGCNETLGDFEIKHLVYGPTGNVLEFWVTFTMNCDIFPQVTGEVLYNVDSSTPTRTTSWGQLKSVYR